MDFTLVGMDHFGYFEFRIDYGSGVEARVRSFIKYDPAVTLYIYKADLDEGSSCGLYALLASEGFIDESNESELTCKFFNVPLDHPLAFTAVRLEIKKEIILRRWLADEMGFLDVAEACNLADLEGKLAALDAGVPVSDIFA